jgi:hypothetical protein
MNPLIPSGTYSTMPRRHLSHLSNPDELESDYPADMTPEERVEHVLTNEYLRWQGMNWIATDIERAQSVVRERLL